MMAAVRDYTIRRQVNPLTGNTAYVAAEPRPVRKFLTVAMEDVTELIPGAGEYPETLSEEEYDNPRSRQRANSRGHQGKSKERTKKNQTLHNKK